MCGVRWMRPKIGGLSAEGAAIVTSAGVLLPRGAGRGRRSGRAGCLPDALGQRPGGRREATRPRIPGMPFARWCPAAPGSPPGAPQAR